MPQKAWSAKRERQYEHIKAGLEERGRSEDTAEEIAARTVNKERARAGESEEKSRTSVDGISSSRRGGSALAQGPRRPDLRSAVRGGEGPEHPGPLEDVEARAAEGVGRPMSSEEHAMRNEMVDPNVPPPTPTPRRSPSHPRRRNRSPSHRRLSLRRSRRETSTQPPSHTEGREEPWRSSSARPKHVRCCSASGWRTRCRTARRRPSDCASRTAPCKKRPGASAASSSACSRPSSGCRHDERSVPIGSARRYAPGGGWCLHPRCQGGRTRYAQIVDRWSRLRSKGVARIGEVQDRIVDATDRPNDPG